MPTAAPELPPITDQTKFNLERWTGLCADPFYATLEHRIEMDAHGNVVMRPPPEICIEVLSPSNTRAEIDEKRRLYFESGADEVWICGLDRSMRFFLAADPEGEPLPASPLCPGFPRQLPAAG